MAIVNNGKKRPKIRKVELKEVCACEEVVVVNEIEETPVIEEVEQTIEVVEEVAQDLTEVIEDVEETAEELVEEIEETEDVLEDVDEVPLEMSEDEMQVALDEEGSLDGTMEEVEELASEGETEEVEEEMVEPEAEEIVEDVTEPETEETVEVEESATEEIVEEPVLETVEEVAQAEETPATEETVEEVLVEAEPVEEIATSEEENVATEPIAEENEVVEVATESEETPAEDDETEEDEEEKVEEKPKKDEFKLTAPANLGDILANICTKRARKLIYRPNEVLFSHTTTVLGTDKANDEKVKVKNILDAEIKQGVKLGYLDKFDGLKMSELKEEYENDIVYEFADQEFKRTGILLDGDKVKVYIYDWDLKACHHVGYIDDESANLVKPYLIDREKYSFDINGIIVGGKYKKIIKDEKSGKITVEKGNDGNLGLEIDINVINRKD